jgi:hypothetical protein
MIIELKTLAISFIQVSIFTLIGALIAWVYIGIWVIGAYWGSILGVAVFIATQSDSSPLVKEHFRRLE